MNWSLPEHEVSGRHGHSPRTVEFLRSLKHEAMHLSEEGLERLPDAAILEKARRERQVLLTSDLGFAELIAASQEKLPSVIIFRLRSMRPANVNHHLQEVVDHHLDALDEGAIVSITEGRIRVRPLPIEEDEE